MTWEKFWSIIDRVRAQADMQDEASVKQFLYTELIKLPQDELLSFDCAWQSYRNKANFPKMVAAACIINDGSSDDRFTDFRNWLIMQGYDAYRQALIDPDNLAALNIPFRDTEWMGCGNVAWYAYAGQKLRTYFEKAGIAAELHRRYPTLLKLPDDLHRAIMQEQLAPHRAQETEWERQMLRTEVKHLAANFTDEVAAQINGILHDIQTGESTKPNLQEQLEQTQQEFDRLLEMSLDFDENTPFLDDKLKKLNNKIKSLKKAIEDSAARQEKARQPEMLLSAKDLQIQEYDDALTARIIEKITVRSRNEIEIRFIGGYKKTMQLT